MKTKTLLHYDIAQDQWCVHLGQKNYPLHCGEAFLLYIGKTAYPCRIEFGASWYVILGDIKFSLYPHTQYTVCLDA
jgi:hypothetical protein